MYHYSLSVVAFTRNELLREELAALKPEPRFSHNLRIFPKFETAPLNGADIVCLDLDGIEADVSIRQVRALIGEKAKFICCMRAEEEDRLSEAEAACLDDVWLTPVRAPRLRMRMRHILGRIRSEFDASQHKLWLDTLIDSMPDLVWFKDLDGVHRKVNSKFCEFVSKRRSDVEGATHAYIWDIPETETEYSCQESENAAIRSGTTVLTDEIVKSGNVKHLLKTYKTALKGPGGEILGTVGFAHDITNLLNLDMELKFFIESMPFPLVICNVDGKISGVNSHFLEFFQEKKEDMLNMPFSVWENKTLSMATSPVDGERYLRFYKGRGRLRYVDMTRKNILDIFGKKVGSFQIFRDITAEKELEIRIWKEANTDSLTRLANRHAFDNFVKKLRKDAPIHLFYIDLDAFKMVNDMWGHKAGDEALKLVGNTIRKVFSEDFPARLGGDEFIVCVQRNISLEDLKKLGSQLLSMIHERFQKNPQLSKMSASIGIRAGGSRNIPIETLIRQADVAMYAAKSQGKDQYRVWDESLERKSGEDPDSRFQACG